MNEMQFLQKNRKIWENLEAYLEGKGRISPDHISDMFIRLTDDLAYSRSFFPGSETTQYLNQLAQKAQLILYQNKRSSQNRIIVFWRTEFPLLVYESRKEIFYSFLILLISTMVGIISNQADDGFSRIILGNRYVNMTLSNIRSGDPLAVYKSMSQLNMFLGITLNNIMVSFYAFAMGLLSPIGVGYILMKNGVMIGTFHSFMAEQGFLPDALATIWVHGTYEIFAIIVAGGAGIIIGNSLIFPKTYSRLESFRRGSLKGAKIILGLIPIFIIAGFLEGFITRYTDAPYLVRFSIIGISLLSIIFYFYIYPIHLLKNKNHDKF